MPVNSSPLPSPRWWDSTASCSTIFYVCPTDRKQWSVLKKYNVMIAISIKRKKRARERERVRERMLLTFYRFGKMLSSSLFRDKLSLDGIHLNRYSRLFRPRQLVPPHLLSIRLMSISIKNLVVNHSSSAPRSSCYFSFDCVSLFSAPYFLFRI